MRRREVGISIAAGLALVLLVVVNPGGIGEPVIRYVVGPAFSFWYVGAAAIAAAVVLRMANMQPGLVRVLGLIGITWITFVVAGIALLLAILATSGPFGP